MTMSSSISETKSREKHRNQRSFYELVHYLIMTSRLNRYGVLFTTFGGVLSTLLAGIYKLQNEPGSIPSHLILRQTALCLLACLLGGAGGNTWNDLMDRDIDAKVERTKDRPLVSGKVSTSEAVIWMLCLFSASASVLHIILEGRNTLKMMLPLIAVIMLYPLGKRPTARKFHVYPQYFLGTALGYPTIYGWCAIYGNELTLSEILARCYPLWVFLFCWSFFANTAYSYQDAVDDRRMGLNSAYNLAGDHMRAFLAVLGGITLLTIPMVLRPHTSVWLWVSWLGMWTTGIVRQLLEYDQRKPETGGTLHRQTVWFGFCSIAICIVELVWIQLSTAVG